VITLRVFCRAAGGAGAGAAELSEARTCGGCLAADGSLPFFSFLLEIALSASSVAMTAQAKAINGDTGSDASAHAAVEEGRLALGSNLMIGGPASSELDYPIWYYCSPPPALLRSCRL
jgi:hypothetical protein